MGARFRQWVAQVDVIAILLLVVVAELAVYRLAVEVLRQPGEPPRWHRDLAYVGLFTFHLASSLAIGVISWKIWDLVVRRELFAPAARATLGLVAAVFVGLSAWQILRGSPHTLSFPIESSFTALLLLVVLALALRPGDLGVKIGLVFLAVPFVIHFYGTFTLRVLTTGDRALWSNLPDRIREIGNWSLAACALASPLCFAPRPLRASLVRPGPLALAAFVGTISAVVMRKQYEVGMEIAAKGLGVELGPAAPTPTVAVWVLALVAVTWTLVATLSAESPARRLLGAGFALVVASGYAFTFPLYLLAAAVGVLAIAEGGALVAGEELGDAAGRFHSLPIAEPAWREYAGAVAAALGLDAPSYALRGSIEETVLAGRRQGVPFTLRIERVAHAITHVEIAFGEAPPDDEPGWVLTAREGGLLAVGAHPPPPASRAPVVKTGDAAFDRRFRVRDEGGLSRDLLDEGRRAAATAVLDGWVALWPGRALCYRVCPGRGAPLDHPIPVTELAFRGAHDPRAVEKIVSVVTLLADVASRGLKT